MRKTESYLADEELNRLIREVEAGDMAVPPPDMAQNILKRLEEEEKQNQRTTKGSKEKDVVRYQQIRGQKEYRSYCIRVVTSVAAAILLLFTVPQLWSYTSTVNKDSVIFGISRTETEDKEHDSMDTRKKTEAGVPKSSLFGKIGAAHYLSDTESDSIFRGN
ncbi:MAG: hypothetical protein E7294_04590 [Lachnospiraceae bacterium]|jgi:hypothetical protein|nr:hypothetical protein [Lachnospiraceae bacterium]